jgi:hypothetical protein
MRRGPTVILRQYRTSISSNTCIRREYHLNAAVLEYGESQPAFHKNPRL